MAATKHAQLFLIQALTLFSKASRAFSDSQSADATWKRTSTLEFTGRNILEEF